MLVDGPIDPASILQAAERWGLLEIPTFAPEKLAAYGNLLLQWNARLNLTAIRDEHILIERHLMEGVFAAVHQPEAKSVLDFGSGTGIPGIPIAICLQELHVTLAESQRKKAAFLSEAVRRVGIQAFIHADRAETLPGSSFDVVWMRAVDKSAAMLPIAASLTTPGGSLCVLGTGQPPRFRSHESWQWKSCPLPSSSGRVLHIGARK